MLRPWICLEKFQRTWLAHLDYIWSVESGAHLNWSLLGRPWKPAWCLDGTATAFQKETYFLCPNTLMCSSHRLTFLEFQWGFFTATFSTLGPRWYVPSGTVDLVLNSFVEGVSMGMPYVSLCNVWTKPKIEPRAKLGPQQAEGNPSDKLWGSVFWVCWMCFSVAEAREYRSFFRPFEALPEEWSPLDFWELWPSVNCRVII